MVINGHNYSVDELDIILHGIKNGVDPSVFFKVYHYDDELRKIREYAMQGLDVSKIAGNSNLDINLMDAIMEGLKDGIDLTPYINPYTWAEDIRSIHICLKNNVDIDKYNTNQLAIIRKAYEKCIDPKPFMNPEYNWYQMNRILDGLIKNVDITKYSDIKFNDDQMEQIFNGLVEGIDVNMYNDVKYSAQQMREIFLGLSRGIDPTPYCNESLNCDQMMVLRNLIKDGVDVTPISDPVFNCRKMKMLGEAIGKGVDISDFCDCKFSEEQLEIIIDAYVLVGNKFKKYLDPNISHDKMKVYLYALLNDVSIDEFITDATDPGEMFLIYSALRCNKPFDEYIKLLKGVEDCNEDKSR